MTYALIEFAIFGLSLLVALRLLPKIVAYIRDGSTRWTGLGLLVFCVGGFLGNMEFLSEVPAFKLVYAVPAILAFLSPLLNKRPAPAHAISVSSVVLVLLLWSWLVAVNITQNVGNVSDGALFIRLAPGLIWLALLASHGSSPLDRRMLSTMVTFAITVPGLIVPFTEDTWRACDDTKCGLFGGMLIGSYSSENFIGLQIAIVTVLHFVTFGLKRSLYLVPLSLLWLLATESRTAQIALLTASSIALILWLSRKIIKSSSAHNDSPAKRLLLGVIPITFLLVAAYLAFTSVRSDFSGRGWVWGSALQLLQGNEITGLGVDGWEVNQMTGALPPHLGAHSIYVFLGFSGGLIALAIFTCFMHQAMVSSLRHDGRLIPGLTLGVAFLIIGLLEVVWNPIAIDGMSWIPLMLVVAGGSGEPRRNVRTTKLGQRTPQGRNKEREL